MARKIMTRFGRKGTDVRDIIIYVILVYYGIFLADGLPDGFRLLGLLASVGFTLVSVVDFFHDLNELRKEKTTTGRTAAKKNRR